jgi:aminopeptidase N
MENVGLITLDEDRYVIKGDITPLKLLRTAYLIVHEIVHMWFGDFITPEWWNHLWLKEGMATYMGYKTIWCS